LIPSLIRVLHVLNDPSQFTDWELKDYWCVTWMLHKATRRFFLSSRLRDVALSEEVARQLESTIPYNWQILPREMRTGVEPPQVSEATDPKKARVTKRAPFAFTFRYEMDRARNAAKEAGNQFRIATLLGKDTDGEALLGEEFCRLIDGHKKPCIRFFVGGECTNGDNCHCAHKLTQRPTKGALDGVKERLRTLVNVYAKNPKA
jgi:hypothetical protein